MGSEPARSGTSIQCSNAYAGTAAATRLLLRASASADLAFFLILDYCSWVEFFFATQNFTTSDLQRSQVIYLTTLPKGKMKTSTLKSSTRLAYDKRKGLQEKADHVVEATTLARSLKAPFRDGHQKEISPMDPQSVETKGAFTPQTEAKLPSEEMKESFRLLRNEHSGDAFTTPPNDPPARVGAIAVRGPGFSGLDDVSVCTYDNGLHQPDVRTSNVTGTNSSGDTGALVADPVVEDDLEEQIREELEVEMRGEIATAEAVQGETKPSFWKRRSCVFACILSIVAVGAIVGALVGLQPSKDQSEPEVQDPNTLRGLNAGDRWGDFAVLSPDNTTLAVGSDETSYAIVFRRNAIGEWEQLGQTLFGDGQFGRTLAFNRNGSILAVGSWKNDKAGEDAGKTQVFWYNGTFWEEFGTFLGDASRDHFGYSVEMSGTGRILTISAREADPDENRTDAGIVRTYKYTGTVEQRTGSWVKLGPDLQGEDAEEQFGKRLAMNEEGTRLAVSALRWNEERG